MDGETWDTLYSPVYDLSGQPVCSLRVRTLYRFGRPYPRATCLPTSQIVGSTDNWQTWHVVRDYGCTDFHGYETIDMSTWAGDRREVRLAWICHTYDSVNVRYWCSDDVTIIRPVPHTTDVAVSQFLFPAAGFVVAPGDAFSPILMLVNLGSTLCSTIVSLSIDSLKPYGMVVPVPYAGRVPVELTSPYSRYEDGVRLEPGRHTIKAWISILLDRNYNCIEADDVPGNDTLTAEFYVAADTWQKPAGEYPMPDRTIRPGFAMAGSRDRTIYLRNPGGTSPVDASRTRLFMLYSTLHGNWAPRADFSVLFQDHPREKIQLGGAIVAADTLFYCLVHDSGPLMRYNINQNRWDVTSYPDVAARRFNISADLAGGICWDGRNRLYVLGNRNIYWYSITGDTWSLVGDGRLQNLPQPCSDYHDIAFVNGRVYVVLDNRQFICYSTRLDCWANLAELPGTKPVTVCRMAADAQNGRIYMLTEAELGIRQTFVAYDIGKDSWILNLPQPEWGGLNKTLKPGAELVCGGRYLFAFNGGNNDLFVYNLPAPPVRVRPRGYFVD